MRSWCPSPNWASIRALTARSESQLGVDSGADGQVSSRLQPGDLRGSVRAVGEAVERRPSPEFDRLVEEFVGEMRVAAGRGPVCVVEEMKQPMRVDLRWSDAKAVAVFGRLDQSGRKALANP